MISYPFTFAYLGLVFLTALGFKCYPLLIALPFAGLWTPWVICNGIFFVLRDYSQRELGNHLVLLVMFIACIITVSINPGYLPVTVAGYLASELIDWLVFTLTRKPFGERVLLSTMVAAPTETLIILSLIDYFKLFDLPILGWASMTMGTISRVIAGVIVWYLYKRRKP